MYFFLPTSLYLFLPRYVSIHPSTYLSISPKYVHGPVVPAKNSKSIIFKKWILNDLSMTRVRRKISLFFYCAAAQLKSLLSSSCEYYLFFATQECKLSNLAIKRTQKVVPSLVKIWTKFYAMNGRVSVNQIDLNWSRIETRGPQFESGQRQAFSLSTVLKWQKYRRMWEWSKFFKQNK